MLNCAKKTFFLHLNSCEISAKNHYHTLRNRLKFSFVYIYAFQDYFGSITYINFHLVSNDIFVFDSFNHPDLKSQKKIKKKKNQCIYIYICVKSIFVDSVFSCMIFTQHRTCSYYSNERIKYIG